MGFAVGQTLVSGREPVTGCDALFGSTVILVARTVASEKSGQDYSASGKRLCIGKDVSFTSLGPSEVKGLMSRSIWNLLNGRWLSISIQ